MFFRNQLFPVTDKKSVGKFMKMLLNIFMTLKNVFFLDKITEDDVFMKNGGNVVWRYNKNF